MNLPIATKALAPASLPPESKALAVSVAHDVLGKIDAISDAIGRSKEAIDKAADRSLFNVWSTRSDLVAIASSQNEINQYMLDLVNEAINLNVMSYSVLAVMIDEVREGARSGYKTQNGQTRRLSQTGKRLAEEATRMFNCILDGSKATQDAIRVNKEGLGLLREQMDQKAEIDSKQWAEIEDIADDLQAETHRIDALSNSLREKDSLDQHQTERLESLGQAMGHEQATNAAQQRELESLRASHDALQSAVLQLQARTTGWRRTLWICAATAGSIGLVVGYVVSLVR